MVAVAESTAAAASWAIAAEIEADQVECLVELHHDGVFLAAIPIGVGTAAQVAPRVKIQPAEAVDSDI